MDTKKKLFHLSNLVNKKNKLQQQLINYQNQKKTYICNFNTNIPSLNDNNIIINLQQKKNDLEIIIKNYKENINDLSKNKSELYIVLKKLPNELQEKINVEEIIFQEEIDRIKQTHIDLDNQIIQFSYNIFDSKENLYNNIQQKKKQLDTESNILNDIQINAHYNRFNIIQSLKQKKQNKIQHLDTLKQYQNNLNTINNKIEQLKKEQNDLKLFKSKWIDAYHNENQNLVIISSIVNIELFNSLDLNQQITMIDNIISSLDKQISQNYTLFQKIDLQYNNYIESRQKNILEKDLIINNKKDNFKDCYKLQKEKKIYIEEELKKLQLNHINFEKELIEPIIVEYIENIKQLDKDLENANERLNIMKTRLQNYYDTTKLEIVEQINKIDEELKKIKNIMDSIINELGMINSDIKKYNDNYGIIIDLDSKIMKIEMDLKQIEEECKMLEKN